MRRINNRRLIEQVIAEVLRDKYTVPLVLERAQAMMAKELNRISAVLPLDDRVAIEAQIEAVLRYRWWYYARKSIRTQIQNFLMDTYNYKSQIRLKRATVKMMNEFMRHVTEQNITYEEFDKYDPATLWATLTVLIQKQNEAQMTRSALTTLELNLPDNLPDERFQEPPEKKQKKAPERLPLRQIALLPQPIPLLPQPIPVGGSLISPSWWPVVTTSQFTPQPTDFVDFLLINI